VPWIEGPEEAQIGIAYPVERLEIRRYGTVPTQPVQSLLGFDHEAVGRRSDAGHDEVASRGIPLENPLSGDDARHAFAGAGDGRDAAPPAAIVRALVENERLVLDMAGYVGNRAVGTARMSAEWH
jgi:hypothetical protein